MHEINKIYTCMHTHTHTALWLYPPMSMRTRCRERKGSPAKLTFFSSNIIHSSQLNSTSYSLPSLTRHVNLVISSVLAIRNSDICSKCCRCSTGGYEFNIHKMVEWCATGSSLSPVLSVIFQLLLNCKGLQIQTWGLPCGHWFSAQSLEA